MSSLALTSLLSYLDEYLDARGSDYAPNGLQVDGRQEVSRVATGVSACLELFEKAEKWQADTVLVHHGLLWQGAPLPLTGVQYHRVAALIRAGMSLLAYHLPLDRHPEVGNNAVAARGLKLEDLAEFGDYEGLPLGFQGRLPHPLEPRELEQRLEDLYGQAPLSYLSGPASVHTVAIVSGGGQRELVHAIDAGVDAFVTGEVTEWVMNLARESGIHYFAAGHYATERLGILALGDHLRDQHGLEVEFFEIPNPA